MKRSEYLNNSESNSESSSEGYSESYSTSYSESDTYTDSSQSNNLNLEGEIINNYNIISELGRGAYSIVWLGYNITNNKYYAIKVQNPDDYVDSKDEIKILKKIPSNAKYINRLVDHFVESHFINEKVEKFVCSVFELCCGNLDGLARKGNYKNGFPPDIVKIIFKQICKSLNILHNQNKIFNGDLKPDNILLCGINNRDKKYIELYDKANFNNLYTKVKKEYWTSKGKNIKNIKKMDIETKLKILLYQQSQQLLVSLFLEQPALQVLPNEHQEHLQHQYLVQWCKMENLHFGP